MAIFLQGAFTREHDVIVFVSNIDNCTQVRSSLAYVNNKLRKYLSWFDAIEFCHNW